MNITSSAFAIAIGSFGPALAIGIIGAASVLAMARNPQISDKIQMAMIISIAFAEAITIYVLIIALVTKFVP